ncbi:MULTISPECIES: hypothetical protein [unclassified Kitasatospora]|uniref:hypothetical protein n=1 Tax=unclassified Kitasatospora TaxID=2633591 RepID=UPI002473B0D1|nr:MULTISPECIES: hypothetical protein [unclassified Kitasatospora]MDH6123854.1 hypothetical protein [Kitasatospora sp. GP82]MDH6576047.1 hypothetical protein [Kitasatospora sp. MAP5-34]
MSEAQNEIGVVTITAKEIYEVVVGVRDDVRSLAQDQKTVAGTLADHESRLRGVERWKYGVPVATLSGVVATVAAVASYIK